MPLLAIAADGSFRHAWAMPPDAWEALKIAYRDEGLAAACCGGAVVPVTSSTGWQFFRHKQAGCGDHESPAHIVCKTIVAKAAARLGLAVRTEERAPDGAWTADVMVRHPAWTVALEVQLSRIPLATIEDRQDRYRGAGIRGAWLAGFDPPGLRPRRDLPLFRLEPRRDDRFDPVVLGDAPTPLDRFTTRLLTGRVAFVGPPPTDTPSVAAIRSTCWKCCRDIEQIAAFADVPGHALLAPDGILPARDLAKVPELLAAYRSALARLHAASDSLTGLRPPPPGKEAVGMRAHCPWCDAPISLHRLPPGVLDPAAWHRCWTLAGREWSPADRRPPRWVWEDPPAPEPGWA